MLAASTGMAVSSDDPVAAAVRAGASQRSSQGLACGFALLEVVVALVVATVGLLGAAQSIMTAARVQADAALSTTAVALARDKVDEIRGLAWGFDAAGGPQADDSTDLVRGAAIGGAGLSASPEDALDRDIDGYCDYIGVGGIHLGGAPRPSGAIFVRRWRIRADAVEPRNVLDLRVAVVPLVGMWASGDAQSRLPGHVGLRTLVVRTVPR